MGKEGRKKQRRNADGMFWCLLRYFFLVFRFGFWFGLSFAFGWVWERGWYTRGSGVIAYVVDAHAEGKLVRSREATNCRK